MEIKSAEFVLSMADYRETPPVTLPQLAVVGRSNVGKSSLINTLCRQKKLCKISGTPGKTRLINIFLINDSRFISSIFPATATPGSARRRKRRWGEMMEAYFRESTLAQACAATGGYPPHEPTADDDIAMAALYRGARHSLYRGCHQGG